LPFVKVPEEYFVANLFSSANLLWEMSEAVISLAGKNGTAWKSWVCGRGEFYAVELVNALAG